MKLFAILLFITLTCYTIARRGCDHKNSCHVCQKTIYQLKFRYQTKCNAFAHCKTICIKVLNAWDKPGTVFGAFQKDSVGKCDACFRAGFCSQTECQAQKRREQQVINAVVNHNDVKGKHHSPVNGRKMDEMVKKVVENQKINFEKVANKVRSQIKKALKPKKFEKRRNALSKSLQQAAEYKMNHV